MWRRGGGGSKAANLTNEGGMNTHIDTEWVFRVLQKILEKSD